MRVTPARQLALPLDAEGVVDRWAGLPENIRSEVLRLLARMIARGVLADPVDGGEGGSGVGRG